MRVGGVATGQVITGGVVSLTAIVCWQSLVLPLGSVARYVRVITLLQLELPLLALSLTKLTVTLPQLSEAAAPVSARKAAVFVAGAGTAEKH
jgi:hypothetical protein